jgi:hypothetical protein
MYFIYLLLSIWYFLAYHTNISITTNLCPLLCLQNVKLKFVSSFITHNKDEKVYTLVHNLERMPGVAKYLRTKPENTLCCNNIWNLKIVLLIVYIKSEFTYLKRRKWPVLYNFHHDARLTGSESTHFDVWHILKMLLRNS